MEIRKSLEVNFLTCRHCRQPYRKPKALNCLHTFCEVCLEDIFNKNASSAAEAIKLNGEQAENISSVSYRRKWSSRLPYTGGYESHNFNGAKNDQKICCPVCQKETPLPPGGIQDLPTDQLADKLASMVGRMPNFPVCDVCTKQPFLSDQSTEQKMSSSESTPHKQSQFIPKNRFLKPSDESSSEDDSNGNEYITRNGARPSSSDHRQNTRQYQRSAAASVTRYPNLGDGPRRASAACLECSKRMCSTCRDAHSKMPVTADHIMIRVERMEELRCHRHPRELRRFYCLTCRKRICVVCTFDPALELSEVDDKDADLSYTVGTGHADHDVLSIREAIAAYQNELSEKSTTVQVHINQIEALLSSLRACENEMRNLYVLIDESANSFIQMVHKQKKLLQNEVDQIAGVPLDKLTEECNRLSKVANDWYEFLNDDRVTSRLDLMDPIDALTEGGPMIDKVNHCLELTSEPLREELIQQPFMRHLQVAELSVRQTDSGVVSSQSSSSPTSGTSSATDTTAQSRGSGCSSLCGSDKSEHGTDPRAVYWRSRLGKFVAGMLQLGRIVTVRQLAAETQAAASKWVTTAVQTGPELVKSLPPPKGAQRHRAIQVNFLEANTSVKVVQTDGPYQVSASKQQRVETGTQYCSADVNPPVSMYRSLKQLLVQK